MPGTGIDLRMNDPTIVSAFHTALLRQGLVALILVAAVIVAWNLLRIPALSRSTQTGPAGRSGLGESTREPDARRFLRIGFGLLWLLDGLLQAQAAMPLGMVPQVIQPATAGSPSWLQHLVNAMANTWSFHPIVAATATVWIQVGIGVWLLVAPRGNASRLAGVASFGWGLLVWIFGEAFGGVLAPGLTWLFGAPGAVLIYCVAGLLIALPDRHWRTSSLGRSILRLVGLFFLGMALLQAWPGRGFWEGRVGPRLGSLASIVDQMSQTSQPHWLLSWLSSFEGFDIAHGWGVNLFVVIALALIGSAFLSARPRLVLAAVAAATLLCLADWVLIEDLGFLGGVGTDPNSMIPMILLFVGGYLALSRVPATTDARVTSPATMAVAPVDPAGGPTRRPGPRPGVGAMAATVGALGLALGRWRGRLVSDSTYAFQSLGALSAVGVMLIGVAPMAAATTKPNADSILAKAVNGPPEVTNMPTPGFSLIDQHGRRVSLTSLRGKTLALAFVDPACGIHGYAAMGCSLSVAEVLRLTDGVLGSTTNRVELVGIDSNPAYLKRENLISFDGRTGLAKMRNWLYLTGSRSEVSAALNQFGVHLDSPTSSAMGLPHGQMTYVIDGSGRTREILTTGDRGAVSRVMESSVAVALADAIERVAGSSDVGSGGATTSG